MYTYKHMPFLGNHRIQGIRCPLLASLGIALMCAHTHTQTPTYANTDKRNPKNKNVEAVGTVC